MNDVYFTVTGLLAVFAAGLLVGTVYRLTRTTEGR